jgi:hypothetical protein
VVAEKRVASFGGERNRREAFSTGWIGQEFRTNYSITARVPYLRVRDRVERRRDVRVADEPPVGGTSRRLGQHRRLDRERGRKTGAM